MKKSILLNEDEKNRILNLHETAKNLYENKKPISQIKESNSKKENMKKVIKLTESDLEKIVRRVIKESMGVGFGAEPNGLRIEKIETKEQNMVTQNVPQSNSIAKPKETLGVFFTNDPIGKKIASISPTFVKWSNSNNIQPIQSKYQVLPNNTQLTAVGTDGKKYILNLNSFESSKGNIPQDSQGKLNAAREAIKQKVAELNIGQVANSKCFVLNTLPPQKNVNQGGAPNNQCREAYRDYDEVVKSTNFDYYKSMDDILKFASVAPKVQPKQG
jgi:hypothetical protein